MSKKFEYNYSAPTAEERKEIDSIRNQYLPKTENYSMIEQLRVLDKKVKTRPIFICILLGIVGVLTFGLGLTFFLEWSEYWYIGFPISIIGIVIMVCTYPIYVSLVAKYKSKYGPKIIEISNSLLKEES